MSLKRVYTKASFIALFIYPLLEIFKTSQPELSPIARSAPNFTIERFYVDRWVRNVAKGQTTEREINFFFSDSYLAPKFFKVVANSKKVGRHFQR